MPCFARYLGVELQDGTFDKECECLRNTKIFFEWVLTSAEGVERVRDEVGVLRGLDDDGPPLPAHAGAHAEEAAEAAAGQVGEDVAEDERDQIKRQLLM